MHVAVQHLGGKGLGHIAALVELRADVTIRNDDGQNAMTLARYMTNRADEIVKVLSSGSSNAAAAPDADGVQQEKTSDELERVLQVACQRGQVDVSGVKLG